MQSIILENNRRKAIVANRVKGYDPIKGRGSFGTRILHSGRDGSKLHLPAEILADKDYAPSLSLQELHRIRIRYDFEYWCATAFPLNGSNGARLVPNHPQRMVIACLMQNEAPLLCEHAPGMGITTICEAFIVWKQFLFMGEGNSSTFVYPTPAESSRFRNFVSALILRYPQIAGECTRTWRTPRTIHFCNTGATIHLPSSRSPNAIHGTSPSLVLFSDLHRFKYTHWHYDHRHNVARIYDNAVAALNGAHTHLVVETEPRKDGNAPPSSKKDASIHPCSRSNRLKRNPKHRLSYFTHLWHRSKLLGTHIHLSIPWWRFERYSAKLPASVPRFWMSLSEEQRQCWLSSSHLTLEQLYFMITSPKEDIFLPLIDNSEPPRARKHGRIGRPFIQKPATSENLRGATYFFLWKVEKERKERDRDSLLAEKMIREYAVVAAVLEMAKPVPTLRNPDQPTARAPGIC